VGTYDYWAAELEEIRNLGNRARSARTRSWSSKERCQHGITDPGVRSPRTRARGVVNLVSPKGLNVHRAFPRTPASTMREASEDRPSAT